MKNAKQTVSSIPSAKRLITSLRDLGYGFVDAVAEIVDNSIQAGANFIEVKLIFNGEDSELFVFDNGEGMNRSELEEAMRFGSKRDYSLNDLGHFGLGLKTASLSQCDEVTVYSRKSRERFRVSALRWSIGHVVKYDKWELLSVEQEQFPQLALDHFKRTVGTIVHWRRLDRLVGYRWPAGKHAEQEFERMTQSLKIGLGATFHRFLSGELGRRQLGIFVNGEMVESWDPFCRVEPKTIKLPIFQLPIAYGDKVSNIIFQPYLLPNSELFSSQRAFLRAGGLKKWNNQQGFYIYRSGRLLQSGGWSTLRTADEHTKLIRICVDIPEGMGEAFKVNISKMRVLFPRQIRSECLELLAPIVRAGQERYRNEKVAADPIDLSIKGLGAIEIFSSKFQLDKDKLEQLLSSIDESLSSFHRHAFAEALKKLAKRLESDGIRTKEAA